MVNDSQDAYESKRNRRLASGASTVGSMLQFLPNPQTKIIGTLLGIPDLAYDIIDFERDDWKSYLGLSADVAGLIPGVDNDVNILSWRDMLGLPDLIIDSNKTIRDADVMQELENIATDLWYEKLFKQKAPKRDTRDKFQKRIDTNKENIKRIMLESVSNASRNIKPNK